MKLNVRSLCMFVAGLFLVACQSSATSTFSLPDEGVSIEYPKDWFVDEIPLANMVAFYPQKHVLGDGRNSLTLWIVPKDLYPSLAHFASSQNDDEEGRCAEAEPAVIGNHRYDGLIAHCKGGNEYSYIEGKRSYFSVVFNADDENAGTFARMKDSVKVSK